MNPDVVGPAVFWAAALLKLRRVSEPSQRPIVVALTCLATGLTLDVEPVARSIDRVVGINNLSILLKHCVAVVGVFFLLMFMRQVAGREVRSRVAAALVITVLAILMTTFALVGPLPETSDFADGYGGRLFVRAYWLATIGYFAVCLWSLMRLSIGTARQASRREVRVGFGMIAAGVIVGLVYSAIKIVELLSTQTWIAGKVGHVLLIVGALLIGGGLLFPVASGSLEAARLNIQCRALLLRLRPTWRHAVKRRPGVVLGRPSSPLADLVGNNPRARLYRRVIEIEDAALGSDSPSTPEIRSLLDVASALSRSTASTS